MVKYMTLLTWNESHDNITFSQNVLIFIIENQAICLVHLFINAILLWTKSKLIFILCG